MSDFSADALPPEILNSGISFKLQHFPEALTASAKGLWYETHTENFCAVGGVRLEALEALSEKFPLSLHGVGASLAGPDQVSHQHLRWVKALLERINPVLISEHAVWSSFQQSYYADLLPYPRTQQALQILSDNVSQYQEAIKRPLLIENPTHYLTLNHELHEAQFMQELAHKTGCGLLLDITNLYLSQHNCAISARDYIDQIPAHLVGELHVAGYSIDPQEVESLLIDSHNHSPSGAILDLLDYALHRFGPRPVLLEWDDNIPAFADLIKERERIHAVLIAHLETDDVTH